MTRVLGSSFPVRALIALRHRRWAEAMRRAVSIAWRHRCCGEGLASVPIDR
jgi:hypothetical protein